MEQIWIGLLILTFLLCVKSTALGCCMLIFTRILVPDVVRLTPYADISLNTGVIGIIGIFMLRDLLLKRDMSKLIKDKYFVSLVIFTCLLLFTVLFGNNMDFAEQFAYYRQFCITDIFPIIALIYCTLYDRQAKWIIHSMVIAVLINTIYGIATVVIGMNPYAYAIDLLYSTRPEQIQELDVNVRAGTLVTSSTFSQPNQWGTFLPLAFAFHFYYYKLTKSKIILFVLVLITICVFLCAKRSAILAYLSFWAVYAMFMNSVQRLRLFVYVFFAIVVFLIVIYSTPQLSGLKNLVEASIFFWDDSVRDRTDVGGSSMEMRIEQTFYPWILIADNILCGKGFGYSYVYINQFGLHPILKGFETILSYAVTNGGIVGCFTWGLFYLNSYKYNYKSTKNKKFSSLLTITSLVISIANGLALIIFYGIFVVLLRKLKLMGKKYG